MKRTRKSWTLLGNLILTLSASLPAPTLGQVKFVDVPSRHWASSAVSELESLGLIIGAPGSYLGIPARSLMVRLRRRDADLRILEIMGAQLAGANLRGVDLHDTGIAFHRVNLTAADLRDANLFGVDLGGATLTRVELSGANLANANLSFTWARCWPTITANLRYARLTGAILSHAHLFSSDLSFASLNDANLRKADLENAILRDAALRGADLREASLVGADLTGADLTGAKLTAAIYDPDTRWPLGFDPQQSGAALTTTRCSPCSESLEETRHEQEGRSGWRQH